MFPEGIVVLIVLGFFRGCGIVFDEPGEELCIIDLLAEHLFAAGVEECTAFVGRHSNEGFNGAIERFGATRLERSIVATDGAVFGQWRCMDAIAELIDIFQFA